MMDHRRNADVSRRSWRRTWLALGAIGLAVVAALAPTPAAWIERTFSHGLYPILQPPLTRLSNLIPFALLDALIVVAASTVIVWLVQVVRRPRRNLLRFLLRIGTTGAALYLCFLATWGLHYRRVPLRRTLDFDETRLTPDGLERLAERAVTELNLIHPTLPTRWPEWRELRSQLGPAFERARAWRSARRPVELGEPKRSLLGPYFRRTGTDGMVDPFFLEVLVNDGVLPLERPFIVAHEWGHLGGRADESEASFVGWVTCMHGPLWARYSGWLLLYGTITARLPADERAVITGRLTEGPRRDLAAVRERILSQSTPVMRRASGAVYDRFLKANRLPEGMASYGLVVRLMLGANVDVPPLQLQVTDGP